MIFVKIIRGISPLWTILIGSPSNQLEHSPSPMCTFRWCICSWKCLRPWKFFRLVDTRGVHHLVQFLVFETFPGANAPPKRRNWEWQISKLIWWRTTKMCITWRNTSKLFYQDHTFDGYTIINDFLSLIDLYCINLYILWPILYHFIPPFYGNIYVNRRW